MTDPLTTFIFNLFNDSCFAEKTAILCMRCREESDHQEILPKHEKGTPSVQEATCEESGHHGMLRAPARSTRVFSIYLLLVLTRVSTNCLYRNSRPIP